MEVEEERVVQVEATVWSPKELLRFRAVILTQQSEAEDQLGYSAKPISEDRATKVAVAELADEGTKIQESQCRAKVNQTTYSNRSEGDVRKSPKASKPSRPSLPSSPTSWLAHQKARRNSEMIDDAEVERSMKAILNKLTVENFGKLYQQMTCCGICRPEHVEILMREVFEKATTQHHFITMYAELCSMMHRWFSESKVCGDDGKAFKRILLNRCQHSFEEIMRPRGEQQDSLEVTAEQREAADAKHKMQMLGNLKLIGALLEKGMLASKVIVAVVEELIAMKSAPALESLAVFLTAVGGAFDRPSWTHHASLRSAFQTLEEQIKRKDLPQRTRCLLQDVLDLRASGWENMKKAVRTGDGPSTLDAVLRNAEAECGERIYYSRTPTASSTHSNSPCFGFGFGYRSAYAPQSPSSHMRRLSGASSGGGSRFGGAAPDMPQSPLGSPLPTPLVLPPAAASPKEGAAHSFNAVAFHEDMCGILRGLSETLEVEDCLERLRSWTPPPAHSQAVEVTELLSSVAEWGRSASRKAGFELLARLFYSATWTNCVALDKGLSEFFARFNELKLDIPELPRIVQEELAPVLAGLGAAGLLKAGRSERLLAVAA